MKRKKYFVKRFRKIFKCENFIFTMNNNYSAGVHLIEKEIINNKIGPSVYFVNLQAGDETFFWDKKNKINL